MKYRRSRLVGLLLHLVFWVVLACLARSFWQFVAAVCGMGYAIIFIRNHLAQK